jgi:adenine-specific DNA methylase
MTYPLYNLNHPTQLNLPMELPERVAVWRPIHYLGSKLRLTESINQQIAKLCSPGDVVCDLFAGSGTVSRSLSSNYRVIASDIQEYSRVLCTALLKPALTKESDLQTLLDRASERETNLENSLAPILEFEERALAAADANPSLLCDLSERSPLLAEQADNDALSNAMSETKLRLQKLSPELLATVYFGGTYFSFRQALQLDCLLYAIDNLPVSLRDTFLAALLSTASTIVNSIGKQFAQPIRPRHKDGSIKTHLIKQMHRDRTLDAHSIFFDWVSRYRQLSESPGHRVVRDDYRNVLRDLGDVAVVYADPPYTRDHYSRFYHVLETLSLRDSPAVSTKLLTGEGSPSRGAYRKFRHQSPFCIKSQAHGAFDDLFRDCRDLGTSVLLSYSPFVKDGHPRMMTVKAIQQIAEKYYSRVQVESAKLISHSKLNKAAVHLEASSSAEVFIICQV